MKLNTTHGLPLSLADRKAAALRILSSYPEWSDRAIAAIAGVSPKTVSAIRSRSTVEIPQSTGRIARNGVLHRSAGRQGRQRAAELFAADPNVSTRKVALAAGISVTTAKDVRKRLRYGEEPIAPRGVTTNSPPASGPDGKTATNMVPIPAAQRVDTAEVLRRLRKDPSLRFTETGRKLLRWLEIPDDTEWETVVRSIPGHCAPTIAALARQNCQHWQKLADQLDRPMRPENSLLRRLCMKPPVGTLAS
ncbi:hypothetical protein ACWEO2_41110 [Nocardia sp. NPDC004278]